MQDNAEKYMSQKQFQSIAQLHHWTCEHFSDFWQEITNKLDIVFKKPYTSICDTSDGIENTHWFVDGKINITDSCLNKNPNSPAIIYKNKTISYGELHQQINQVSNSLVTMGFEPGDNIAICMPMSPESIYMYLGIIRMGGIAVCIADSFSADEIKTRCDITHTKAIFTQDFIYRDNKTIPLYSKIKKCDGPDAIVILTQNDTGLRLQDHNWDRFLENNSNFNSFSADPNNITTILFSSGTTGEPKAIPWHHHTAIKCASDGFFHQDITPNDIICWPTNLGWMMGPWLIYASLINGACIGLYTDSPLDKNFGKFIEEKNITILGLVPSMVNQWRLSQNMEGFNWDNIKLFSSTGECSNADDMSYLSELANNKPIIEYCGGTEIGGAYITSTLSQNPKPGFFTTPAMGIDFVCLDENGLETQMGEVGLIPPSIGLSTKLLNKNHYEIYYENMPLSKNNKILRRHGDIIEKIDNHTYRAHGRSDDTMNLGGIKTSSAQIERVLNTHEDILETAAIAINPKNHGPSELIIYAVLNHNQNKNLLADLNQLLKTKLNPLFKISELVIIDNLPRTASNKIMRRVLRDDYAKN